MTNYKDLTNIELIPFEFAVQVTCEKCVCKLTKAIEDAPEFENKNYKNFVKDWNVDIPTQTLFCETSLPGFKMLEILRRSGLEVRLKSAGSPSYPSAVTEFHDVLRNGVVGVIRFIPLSRLFYVLEGAFAGLPDVSSENRYCVSIHEFGDLSNPDDSCGPVFQVEGVCDGVLGYFTTPTAFYMSNLNMDMSRLIGRSCVVTRSKYGVEEVVAVGIVARSAGVYENPKMFCTCDGLSIFDEQKLIDKY